MNREEVFSKVRTMIASPTITIFPEEEINEQTTIDEMDIDSLDFAELTIRLEDKFKFSLEWESWMVVRNVGDIVDVVMKNKKI